MNECRCAARPTRKIGYSLWSARGVWLLLILHSLFSACTNAYNTVIMRVISYAREEENRFEWKTASPAVVAIPSSLWAMVPQRLLPAALPRRDGCDGMAERNWCSFCNAPYFARQCRLFPFPRLDRGCFPNERNHIRDRLPRALQIIQHVLGAVLITWLHVTFFLCVLGVSIPAATNWVWLLRK